MDSILTALPAIPLALLSILAGQKSYIAIVNLHSNEERAEKAAKHSQTAADELRRTRLTQASGAATVLLSLLSSVAVLFHLGAPQSSLALVNVAAEVAAYLYITNFWKTKAEVPLIAKEYNEGIRKSNELRRLLVLLGVGWAITGAVGYQFGLKTGRMDSLDTLS